MDSNDLTDVIIYGAYYTYYTYKGQNSKVSDNNYILV